MLINNMYYIGLLSFFLELLATEQMTLLLQSESWNLPFCNAHSYVKNTLWSTGWLQWKYKMLNGCISQMECLTISCWPLFLIVTIMKNCTSCKTEHQEVFHFLFPHGLITMFLVGGLSISVFLHVTSFAGMGHTASHWSKWRTLYEPEKQIWDTFVPKSLNFLRKSRFCVFQTALHFNVWALNWPSIKTAFCFRDTAI